MREVMVKAASPVAESGVVKRVVAPSRRVTVPVGVPAVVLATWVVRVTGEPGVAVALRLLSVMRVGAGLMVRVARVMR